MVRTEQHKYAVDAQGPSYLLHDLQEDPNEQRNLIGYPAATMLERDLRDRMLSWMVTAQVERTTRGA